MGTCFMHNFQYLEKLACRTSGTHFRSVAVHYSSILALGHFSFTDPILVATTNSSQLSSTSWTAIWKAQHNFVSSWIADIITETSGASHDKANSYFGSGLSSTILSTWTSWAGEFIGPGGSDTYWNLSEMQSYYILGFWRFRLENRAVGLPRIW